MKRFLSILFTALFVLFVPILLLFAVKNLDSLFSLLFAVIAAAISVPFFLLSKFKTKRAWIITLCCAGVILLINLRGIIDFPSIATIWAVDERFSDISTWIIWDIDSVEETTTTPFSGDFVFYNSDLDSFIFKKVNPESISVIVFYRKSETQHHYNRLSDRSHYGTVTQEHIHIALVNAETKQCFARRSFSAGTFNEISPGNNTRRISHTDPQIYSFIRNYFK